MGGERKRKKVGDRMREKKNKCRLRNQNLFNDTEKTEKKK